MVLKLVFRDYQVSLLDTNKREKNPKGVPKDQFENHLAKHYRVMHSNDRKTTAYIFIV